MRALEEATALDPRLAAAHLRLAQSYEETKEYDKAIDRYRKIVAVNPSEPISLNNLAYALAVRKGQAAEALGYAERADTLTRGNPTIARTLAWIQHLLGRDREAARLLPGIVKALPANAEIRLHAAVIYAAIGMLEPTAAKELQEALPLAPALASSRRGQRATGEARAEIGEPTPGVKREWGPRTLHDATRRPCQEPRKMAAGFHLRSQRADWSARL
jgi:tetratricopeptide (TPR) repeat protein